MAFCSSAPQSLASRATLVVCARVFVTGVSEHMPSVLRETRQAAEMPGPVSNSWSHRRPFPKQRTTLRPPNSAEDHGPPLLGQHVPLPGCCAQRAHGWEGDLVALLISVPLVTNRVSALLRCLGTSRTFPLQNHLSDPLHVCSWGSLPR